MADDKAKQAETKKVEDQNVAPDGGKMPKPLNQPAGAGKTEPARKTTRPETTPTGRYPSPPEASAPLAQHAGLVLSVMIPVDDGGEFDFAPLLEVVEKTLDKLYPGAIISSDQVNPDDLGEEIPPGHSTREITLSDVQWAAIDRQVARGNTTAGKWLRQFLAPYLR
jgi:hypothetical protein